ncbi:hypothetical protein F5Y15DRAFT_414183 [Xylariaceae sp. FL0016]|nr:hypothetical protein F5Y15DRAFT_414183 [Xylariaceae sp. FL0016]
MSEPLTKVDSAVEGLGTSPPKEKKAPRKSSVVTGVASMKELKENKTEIELAKETQGTGWKINSSPMSIDDKDILKQPLVLPLVRAVDLHFKHGVVVTARNRLGVTIKDAMDAIHKPNKKRADDELDEPYLKGFEWLPNHPQIKETNGDPQKEEERLKEWDRLYIHLSSVPGVSNVGGGKKKKNKHAE